MRYIVSNYAMCISIISNNSVLALYSTGVRFFIRQTALLLLAITSHRLSTLFKSFTCAMVIREGSKKIILVLLKHILQKNGYQLHTLVRGLIRIEHKFIQH